MPRCAACGLFYPVGERFCGHDGAALLEETPSAPVPTVDLVGQMVGTYQLTRKIGEGGMGAVYEAVHPVLDRRIAMKIVHPPYARDPQVVARFFDEARALGKLRHPNIVEVYDLGQSEDGTVFLAMELLVGRDLRARLKEGALSVAEIRKVFLPIAEGLAAAHEKGIIHRDLKPENIFLCEGGGVKILDFGVVKLTDRADGAFARTHTGMIVGTPEYMSPEQAAGKKELDHRSDIYSFGLLLYEALSGHRPFEAESLFEILTQQVQGVFPSPSERAGRPLDKTLEAVTMRCLAKDPKARYGSMTDVIHALTPAIPEKAPGADRKTEKESDPPKEREQSAKEKRGASRPGVRRFLMGLGVAAALPLVLLSVRALLDATPPPPAPEQKEPPVVSLEALATYLPETTEAVIDLDLSEAGSANGAEWLSLIEPLRGISEKVDAGALQRVVLGISLKGRPRLETAVFAGRIEASAVKEAAAAQNLALQEIPEGLILRAQTSHAESAGRFVLSSAAREALAALPEAPLRVALLEGDLARKRDLLGLSSYRQPLSGAGAAVLPSDQGQMLYLLLQTGNAVHAWDLQGSLLKSARLPGASWRVQGKSLTGTIPLANVTLSRLASLSW